MSITTIRTGIAANIGTISGIRTYADIPDNPAMPCAIVTLDGVTYDRSFQRGLTEYNFVVTVIFGRIATTQAQRALDQIISTGDRSIKAAVESDKTLGGAAFDTHLSAMTSVSSVTIGDMTYLSADFAVQVFAN
jgi:hypothetical protein